MLRVEYALTTDRTMKALTGLTRSAFHALVPAFDQALHEKALHRNPPRQRRPGGGGPATLKTAEAKLFFILIYVKCYPTLTSLRCYMGCIAPGRIVGRRTCCRSWNKRWATR